MAKDNLTAVLYGINDLRLEQTPIDEPEDNDVLLEMACVGICGSDVHYLVDGRIGDFIVEKPMIIGHESAGTVCKVGKNVTNLKVGDRVALEPGIPCRMCSYCKEGRYNLCNLMVFCATPPVHGSLRRFYKHPADFCFKLPDNMSHEEGALLEPLSVGVHACKRANIGIGSNVLILGAGPIGLVNLLVAKAMGAKSVMITDLFASRLEAAKQFGADYTLQIDRNMKAEDVVKKIHEMMGCEPDRTIEATGANSSMHVAILATKSGGVAVFVGCSPEPLVKIPLMNALVREVDIRGVFRYVNCYPDALNLVATGKVNVKPLITHRYKIEETVNAFDTAKTPEKGAIKVMISC